jgi:hypothetical protein
MLSAQKIIIDLHNWPILFSYSCLLYFKKKQLNDASSILTDMSSLVLLLANLGDWKVEYPTP